MTAQEDKDKDNSLSLPNVSLPYGPIMSLIKPFSSDNSFDRNKPIAERTP